MGSMVRENTAAVSRREDVQRYTTDCKYRINHSARSYQADKNRHHKTLNFEMEVPMLRKLFCDESGQDMIEYALLASFISIVAIATLRLIGPLVSTIYDNIVTALS